MLIEVKKESFYLSILLLDTINMFSLIIGNNNL